MKNWATIASLLFLLSGPALATPTPEQAQAITEFRGVLSPISPQQLEVREAKKGGGSSGGSSGDKDEENKEEEEEDPEDSSSSGSGSGSGSGSDEVETCTTGDSCSDCFGPGYQLCEGSESACYNPDINATTVACEEAERIEDEIGSGSSRLGQGAVLASSLAALGVAAVML